MSNEENEKQTIRVYLDFNACKMYIKIDLAIEL